MGSRTAIGGSQNDNGVVNGMPSFVSQIPTSATKPIGKEGETIHTSQIPNFGALEQSLGFRIEDAVDLSKLGCSFGYNCCYFGLSNCASTKRTTAKSTFSTGWLP
jgi:hypothetical protein